jgi:hypothetical protein
VHRAEVLRRICVWLTPAELARVVEIAEPGFRVLVRSLVVPRDEEPVHSAGNQLHLIAIVFLTRERVRSVN